MKKKLIIVLMALALLTSLAGNAFLTTRNLQLGQQNARLNEELAITKLQVEAYQMVEQHRYERDRQIFLEDPHGFLAAGVIRVDQAVVAQEYVVHEEDGTDGIRYQYRLDGEPVLHAEHTGETIRIEAYEGETIHLMTFSRGDGPIYLGYYICYTNSTHCGFEIIETTIVVRESR